MTYFFLSNCSIFQSFFVPVPFCELVRTWSSFLSILLWSHYLQSNFGVPGPCGSLSWGVSFTVLVTVIKAVVHYLYPATSTVRPSADASEMIMPAQGHWKQ